MTDLNVEGMALAPGVVETIASIAAKDVDGVASVGPSSSAALFPMFGNKSANQGIEINYEDDDKLDIAVRVEVYYGYVLPEVAANLRQAISDAVSTQVGIQVNSVDVYIDAINFAR